ncbi:DeoR/GlpR family DNA-binding transcription regulator [Pseudonocardia nigra]|uniref:DeoR/GlpR family DNA-binding transcription regulator n=1 Tax=Pseudonocardia nigra TaxID=1921578 RepID=UPI001C5EAD28|nr:DeoR/GlpR family DNA-binding transcription regulator [Pseudonocardia nigra]
MYAEERQQAVAERVMRDGRVDVAQLVEEFAVTGETVRRDLVALERRGVLRRTHGGAIPVKRLGFEPATPVRAAVMQAEKERIARAALHEVPSEGAILIDTGTTTGAVAEMLPDDRQLKVVTNSLQVINALVNRPNITLMALGGRIRSVSMSSVDAWALRALSEVRVDVAFIGANGVTVEHGMTTSDQAEASVKAAMVHSGRRVVLLADHSKVGTEYFHLFGDLSQVDVLITDSGLDDDLAEDLRAAGPHVVIA